jgi:hypothetical protein
MGLSGDFGNAMQAAKEPALSLRCVCESAAGISPDDSIRIFGVIHTRLEICNAVIGLES